MGLVAAVADRGDGDDAVKDERGGTEEPEVESEGVVEPRHGLSA
jgi:hypothetical protein